MTVIFERREYKHVDGFLKINYKKMIFEKVTKIEMSDKALFIEYFCCDGKESLFSRVDEIKNLIVEE